MMAIMMTASVIVSFMAMSFGSMILTNDDQGVPLPFTGVAGTLDGLPELNVGISKVPCDSLRPLVNILDRWSVLFDCLAQLGDQLTKLNYILLDFLDFIRT